MLPDLLYFLWGLSPSSEEKELVPAKSSQSPFTTTLAVTQTKAHKETCRKAGVQKPHRLRIRLHQHEDQHLQLTPETLQLSHGMSSPPSSHDSQTDSEPLLDLFNHLLIPTDSSQVLFHHSSLFPWARCSKTSGNSERPKDNNFCDLVRRHRITVFPSPPKDLVSFCWRSGFYFCMR